MKIKTLLILLLLVCAAKSEQRNQYKGIRNYFTLLENTQSTRYREITSKRICRKDNDFQNRYETADSTIRFLFNSVYSENRIAVVSHDRLDVLASPNGEIVTEAEYLEPVIFLDDTIDGWYHVELPLQRGYTGYLPFDRIFFLSGAPYEKLVVVDVPTVLASGAPDSGLPIRNLRGGTILPVISTSERYYLVDLEEGPGWISRDSVLDLTFTSQLPSANEVISNARRMLGQDYVWGGATWGSTDCSGFVNIVFRISGLLLKRDCGIQYDDLTGKEIGLSEALPGDLVYISTYLDTPSHVGIISHNNMIIHCCSRGVVEEEFANSIFNERELCGCKRFCNN